MSGEVSKSHGAKVAQSRGEGALLASFNSGEGGLREYRRIISGYEALSPEGRVSGDLRLDGSAGWDLRGHDRRGQAQAQEVSLLTSGNASIGFST